MAKYCGSCWRYNDLFFEPPICDRHILSYFFDDTKKAKDCPEYESRYNLTDEDWEDETDERLHEVMKMSKRTQSIVGSDMSAEIKALSDAIKALELLPYMIDILDTFAKTTEYSGTATLRRELIQKAKDVMQK